MNKSTIVTVVGSINMDLTVTTDRVPEKGETVMGKNFATYPGGKGANQAVAAARLGATVQLIGAVGDDTFGKSLRENLQREGIDTTGVEIKEGIATGTATIMLAEQDNRIIVAPGANSHVTIDMVAKYEKQIKNSDVVLLQLEIPMETISYVTSLAHQFQVPIIVNPAPYQQLPEEVYQAATFITPNEGEAKEMFSEVSPKGLQDKLIITKGSEGTLYFDHKKEKLVPAYSVSVQDTTGAGDTFNGALAVQIGGGATREAAIQFANAAAGLSVTKIGAQAGMPSSEQVLEFMQKNK
ncbi:ribokinase [Ornithinibacillus massiliensis]|uniref:Ribokinase n=1 Tax=Ornithinibacillus massiliensis TaxID=1944633 RepID=A0ABS5ME77_9BACI|nr:ribokinase [Ornithinibacillus massiliensis]MBS3680639.1 ribokinase [Ornithinibacillus massiliensis]